MVEAPAYLVVGAAVLFALFWAVQAFWPRTPRAERSRKKRELSEAVTRGSDETKDPKERAAALVQAGRIALNELDRPRLAARQAEWAHRLAPASPEVIALLYEALPRARRLQALERLLWLSIDAQGGVKDASPGHGGEEALDALIAVYRGPLKRPERAHALERLRRTSASGKAPSA